MMMYNIIRITLRDQTRTSFAMLPPQILRSGSLVSLVHRAGKDRRLGRPSATAASECWEEGREKQKKERDLTAALFAATTGKWREQRRAKRERGEPKAHPRCLLCCQSLTSSFTPWKERSGGGGQRCVALRRDERSGDEDSSGVLLGDENHERRGEERRGEERRCWGEERRCWGLIGVFSGRELIQRRAERRAQGRRGGGTEEDSGVHWVTGQREEKERRRTIQGPQAAGV
jgi:hypothetical protein